MPNLLESPGENNIIRQKKEQRAPPVDALLHILSYSFMRPGVGKKVIDVYECA